MALSKITWLLVSDYHLGDDFLQGKYEHLWITSNPWFPKYILLWLIFREDYHQLVYQALSLKTDEIKLLPPAIVKPCYLWSGKQILSTVIINIIPKGIAPINLTATSKIPSKVSASFYFKSSIIIMWLLTLQVWQSTTPRIWRVGGTPFENPNTMTEAEVIIRGGELLVGILDKSHYGATPYGFIHCIYEVKIPI